MEQAYRDFAARWANAVIARDFATAHGMLASWLQTELGADDLRTLLDEAREDRPEPARFALDGNQSRFEDLEEPEGFPPRSKPFDPGVTAQNFRQWLCVEFKPTEDSDFDACFDLWMAVVEEHGRLTVGYLEPSEAD